MCFWTTLDKLKLKDPYQKATRSFQLQHGKVRRLKDCWPSLWSREVEKLGDMSNAFVVDDDTIKLLNCLNGQGPNKELANLLNIFFRSKENYLPL